MSDCTPRRHLFGSVRLTRDQPEATCSCGMLTVNFVDAGEYPLLYRLNQPLPGDTVSEFSIAEADE